ncbi:MAG: hormogonium polysaccharide biosynthesis glycosyltransferase HpsO [Gomphosphaeria aponina SAG 52.96 = DSM 107014]|uniref:Hormogonium polysaccharide biosynthesis glycosyltransferase HpsO n=1 Tax=Gomphosphaeria aponina SAG 52.96 = DSM 107014 TaxID=1521640 RepID=A0A941JT44_9CHRO|nr:hormogonium polysaccharide biosynthesis glycosyltransferase HpsO [Gomphosphaeria aponina SAG 52.96 = DSM 107014]
MKILVASHTYIVELNCEKLRTLAHLETGIEVTVVVPQRWRPVQNQVIETQTIVDGSFRVVPIANLSENNQGLLTFGTEIIDLLRQFQPQIIQVEQGAKSLAYAQLITLNRFLKLQAKNVFFTWWNLPYAVKFPVSLLEKYNLRHTDGLIAGNQDGADVLHEHGYTGKTKVIPQLGVDERLFLPQPQPELAAKLGIKSDDFVVGFVGRFVEEKGILTLIKSLAGLKHFPWKLLLLGRGDLQDKIREIAGEVGMKERLIFVESVPHHQVAGYINLMKTLVLPSETTYKFKTLTAVGWQEQFGHVLIEAMACKVPVIGSNSGEIPYVIGEAGLVFPEGDVVGLTDCLRQVMESESLRENLAELGYKRVMEKYTNYALAREQLAFYRELIG